MEQWGCIIWFPWECTVFPQKFTHQVLKWGQDDVMTLRNWCWDYRVTKTNEVYSSLHLQKQWLPTRGPHPQKTHTLKNNVTATNLHCSYFQEKWHFYKINSEMKSGNMKEVKSHLYSGAAAWRLHARTPLWLSLSGRGWTPRARSPGFQPPGWGVPEWPPEVSLLFVVSDDVLGLLEDPSILDIFITWSHKMLSLWNWGGHGNSLQ